MLFFKQCCLSRAGFYPLLDNFTQPSLCPFDLLCQILYAMILLMTIIDLGKELSDSRGTAGECIATKATSIKTTD